MSSGSSGDATDDRDGLRHDLLGSLTVVSAHTQLLQRRVLRAQGLSTLERDLLLSTTASILSALEQHRTHLERALPDGPASRGDASTASDAST